MPLAGLAAYAGVLIALTWARPLWLDEMLQMVMTREADFLRRIEWVRLTPGAVPLSFETQHFVMRLFGASLLSARLTSEVFGVVALAGMLLLAREIGTRGVAVMAAAWAVVPLILRYAVEARPYSQALALSIVSSLLLFRTLRWPGIGWAAAYAATVLAALYTLPYSLFLQLGLAVPLFFEPRTDSLRRATIYVVVALLVAGVLFAPWVVYSAYHWTQYSVRTGEGFHWTARLPLLLVREISGGSYVCSLALLTLAGFGCASRHLDRAIKRRLLAAIVACVVLAFAGDLVFNYFFAIRQILLALVPLCLLAGEGWAEMRARFGAYVPGLLLLTLVASAIVKDASYFGDRSENWELAARSLARDTVSACVIYPTSDFPDFYELFEPELKDRICQPGSYAATIFVPVTKYSSLQAAREITAQLASQGYGPPQAQQVGKAIEIRRYSR